MKCLLCVSLVVLFFHVDVMAQPGKIITLENADSLEGKVIDGEKVRELIGNVRFSQENVRIRCDRALQYLESGKVLLTGNVVVRDDSVTMRTPRGMYYRDERRAEAFENVSLDDGNVRLTAGFGRYFVDLKRAFFRSNVVVRDTASTVKADSLTYYRTEKHSVATGNVSVYNTTDNVTIRGNHLDHLSATQYSRMVDHPVLVQIDTSASGKADTLVVRSRVMEAYRDSTRRLLAIDSVEIVRADLAGVAGLAVFFTAADSILLRTSPVVWYQKTQVSGDSINIYLKFRKLRLVSVMGNAFAVSPSDSAHQDRYDQLTGETMRLHFVRQALERIDVDNHAISVYHLYEDNKPNGLNKTSGDRIVMAFTQGKINAIRIYGGVEGQYFPENIVRGREQEYAIPGFRWHDDRPRIITDAHDAIN